MLACSFGRTLGKNVVFTGMEDKFLTSKLRQIREGLEMAYQRQGSGRNLPWELVLVIKAFTVYSKSSTNNKNN